MSIKKLSPLLANQIAAGEVVERPSSVVKELLENAVDAGAKRIQVDIERGGTRLIRITDDGHGIERKELELALARHATSKIEHTNDLKAIHTLGFRGEALASISSVAKLTLSSKPKVDDGEEHQAGWSAIAQGQEMAVEIQPRSMPQGTIVEVRDLFFNTPARQKFLRAERTEYVHIEETIKRTALATPNIAFTLKHNGKVTKRIPAAHSKEQQKQRVGSIVGNSFLGDALYLDSSIEGLHFFGWLSSPERHQNSTLSQYVFVNGRAVRDRTLSHAIRQAYQDLLPTGRMPAYVLYLELDAEQVDVNVHPTKHEVRFSDARTVHDFIAKAVVERLEQQSSFDGELDPRDLYHVEEQKGRYHPRTQLSSNISHDSQQKTQTDEYYHPRLAAGVFGQDQNEASAQVQGRQTVQRERSYQSYKPKPAIGAGQFIMVDEQYLMQQLEQGFCILDVKGFWLDYIRSLLKAQWQQGSIKQRPLLIPARLGIPSDDLSQQHLDIWAELGFDFNLTGPKSVALRQVPSGLEHVDVKNWVQQALYNYVQDNHSKEELEQSLQVSLEQHWSPEPNTAWTNVLQSHSWQTSPFSQTFQADDIAAWLARKR